VLRVAGGIIVAAQGWRMLNQPDAPNSAAAKRGAQEHGRLAQPLAFYPLTMPLTTGPAPSPWPFS